jgi:hypothetical protein
MKNVGKQPFWLPGFWQIPVHPPARYVNFVLEFPLAADQTADAQI